MLLNTLSLKDCLKIRYFHLPARSGLQRNVSCSNWNSWCNVYKSKLSKQFYLVWRQFSPCFRALILISFMLRFALVHWLFCQYLPVFYNHLYSSFCYIFLLFYPVLFSPSQLSFSGSLEETSEWNSKVRII